MTKNHSPEIFPISLIVNKLRWFWKIHFVCQFQSRKGHVLLTIATMTCRYALIP